MYVVLVGDEETQFAKRQDAIRHARVASKRKHHPVHIRHNRGIEKMLYIRGRLEEGVYTTPDRRSRAR